MTEFYTIKNIFKEAKLFRKRLIITIFFIVILTLLLIGRFVQLQVIQHNLYTTLSKNNSIDLIPVAPRRGLIYDRNGAILAKNIPVFNLMIQPSKTKDLKNTIRKTNKLIPLTENDLTQFYKQLKQHRRFEKIPLKIKLSDQEVARFAVDSYRFPGVFIAARLIRYYPKKEAFSHTVGYVGRMNAQDFASVDSANYSATNFIGKTGVEEYYEALLHGQTGYKKVEIDAAGRVVRQMGIHPAIKGSDIYLSIDSQLQFVTEKAFADNAGALIAIQPKTGQVLALVSQPGFNPNKFVNGISNKDYQKLQNNNRHPLYNRALRGLYAPGSTIKPFIALAGLDSNIIDTKFKIYDPGWYKLPNNNHVFHDWKLTGHGWVNLKKAVIVSCDTFFYELARLLGMKKIDSMLSNFGFGKLTGIDNEGEVQGTLPTPQWKRKVKDKSWFTGDTVNAGIGQGFLQITPLQLATATAALANRGVYAKPSLLYAIKNPENKKIYSLPKLNNGITLASSAYWEYIIDAMQKVITEGTGKRFGSQKVYTVAGKTGTAQIVSIRFNKNHKAIPIHLRNNSLFIAFAPVHDPQIAVAVVIENSKGAILVARKVLDAYFAANNSSVKQEKDSA